MKTLELQLTDDVYMRLQAYTKANNEESELNQTMEDCATVIIESIIISDYPFTDMKCFNKEYKRLKAKHLKENAFKGPKTVKIITTHLD